MAQKTISASYSSWTGTSSADKVYIQSGASYSNVSTGAGKDSITNYADHTTMYAGAGNDTIRNWGDTVSVSGGAGNDLIYSYSYYATIDGDAGNDRISLNASGHHNVIRYYSGEGNDTVYNLGSTDSIRVYGGTYTRSTVGSDVVLGVGSGSVTVKDAAYRTVNVIGSLSSSDDTIPSPYPSTYNTIRNSTSYTTVYGTSSNDSIYNSASASHTTIYGLAGNDTIRNFGDTVSVSGGAGNDLIYSYSYYGTIDGDAGNDRISLNASGHHNVIRYYSGEGNDTIYNLGSTDSISVVGGSYTRSTVGSDVVIRVGSGSVTVKDAAYRTFNVRGSSYTYYNVAEDWISADDDNFANTSANLSSIVKGSGVNYSVDELDFSSDFTSLTPKNNIITYSSKK